MKKISGVKRLKGSGPTNHPIQPGSDLIALGTKPKDGRISGADVSSKNSKKLFMAMCSIFCFKEILC